MSRSIPLRLQAPRPAIAGRAGRVTAGAIAAFATVVAIAALTASPAPAQTTATETKPADATSTPAPYTPQSGQAGKDVIWVPTPQELVDRMLDMAKLSSDDYVIDLGSGDGRTVITAARRGARALGIEYNPDMVALSRRNAAAAGVGDRASFIQGDIFQSDFSRASLITLFLLPNLNLKLRPILLDMKPGTRVVSNSFDMEDWQADEAINGGRDCVAWCRAFKWVIPAKVGGSWQLGDATLQLEQTFQMLTGTLTEAGQAQPISEARMNGTAITFTAAGRRYDGRLDGDVLSGTVAGGGSWRATRRAG
ncbi:MAG: cyclopropane-fatty-acyl-phospholipid synthase family protein [Lautropia sp.]